jgi:hypothetical protein
MRLAGYFKRMGIHEKHKMKVIENLKRLQCEYNIKINPNEAQNNCKDLVQLVQVSDNDGLLWSR